MSVALGVSHNSTCQVGWTAVADDGHRTKGHTMFTVN
ncbi:copper resistance protein CopC [Caballeronia sp.]